MDYKVFIGVDVSKKTLDVSFRLSDNPNQQHQTFSNDVKGYQKLVKWVIKSSKTIQEQWLLCMEHTGLYSLPLACYLQENSIVFCMENAYKIKHSMGMVREKSDKADAHYICRYTFLFKEEIIPTEMPAKIIMKLKVLLSYRERLVNSKVSIERTPNELKEYTDKEVYAYVCKDSQQLINQIEKRIKAIENEILEVVKSDESIAKNYELATSVKGIGMFTALYMIVYTKNFTVMKDSRKFACYSGIAPFKNQSGTTLQGRTKVSHLANKKMKSLLSTGACAAVRSDNELKKYYQRKVAEGKHKMTVLNAVKNKLIGRVFAVIERGTPYVSIISYN
jgi:transposase